ncbi:unnamed protein product, partial [Mesorhabditis spiculigera]
MGASLAVKPGATHRFCGFFHVRTLALCIGAIEIIYLIYQTILVSDDLVGRPSALSASLHAFAVALAFVAVGLHLFGIFRRTPTLLIPHLLMQILTILALFGMCLFSLYALLVGTSVKVNLTLEGDLRTEGLQAISHLPRLPLPRIPVTRLSALLVGLLIIVAVFYTAVAMLTIWCFHVALDCYRWLVVHLAEKAQNITANGHPPIIVDTGKMGHVPAEA